MVVLTTNTSASSSGVAEQCPVTRGEHLDNSVSSTSGRVRFPGSAFRYRLMSTTPDRVAFETGRGTIVSGTVVDEEFQASTRQTETILTVEVNGHRFRVRESETTTP